MPQMCTSASSQSLRDGRLLLLLNLFPSSSSEHVLACAERHALQTTLSRLEMNRCLIPRERDMHL